MALFQKIWVSHFSVALKIQVFWQGVLYWWLNSSWHFKRYSTFRAQAVQEKWTDCSKDEGITIIWSTGPRVFSHDCVTYVGKAAYTLFQPLIWFILFPLVVFKMCNTELNVTAYPVIFFIAWHFVPPQQVKIQQWELRNRECTVLNF